MHQKQETLWLLAALAAPLAHFSGCGWLTAGAAAAAVLPLTCIPKDWKGQSGAVGLVQTLWLGAVAGSLLQYSAACWPSDNDLAVPLTILALAAWTEAASAPRIGAVLALCMALTAVPMAVSGAAKLEPLWLEPVAGEWPWAMCVVLLLPNLPAGKQRGRGTAAAGVMAVSLALLVQGVLSPQVAASVPDPFWQTARTLGYLEPVIAVGATLGWYAMTVWMLQSARIIASETEKTKRWAGVLAPATAAGAILLKVQLQRPVWAVLSGFLWVLTPFLTKIKKVEKT